MQIVHFKQQTLKTRTINHLEGSFKYIELGEGDPSSAENFNLRWVLSESDFFSPRHHHNFDQVRIQVKGAFSFDNDGEMPPGSVGFFPEGTFYGPQSSQAETIQLVMQIGGASKNGYLSESNRIQAVQELNKSGQFIKGRFHPNGTNPDDHIDSFQAVWEYFYKRKMVYPSERFSKPVLMDLAGTAWTQDSERPGIEHQTAWDFGPQTVGLRKLRMHEESSILFSGPITGFLTSGHCSLPKHSNLEQYDVFNLKKGETVACKALKASEWFIFIHPILT